MLAPPLRHSAHSHHTIQLCSHRYAKCALPGLAPSICAQGFMHSVDSLAWCLHACVHTESCTMYMPWLAAFHATDLLACLHPPVRTLSCTVRISWSDAVTRQIIPLRTPCPFPGESLTTCGYCFGRASWPAAIHLCTLWTPPCTCPSLPTSIQAWY